jgi:hypothetical protein
MHSDYQCAVVLYLWQILHHYIYILTCAMAQHDTPVLVILQLEWHSDLRCAIEQHAVPLAVTTPLELNCYLRRWG